MKGYTQYVRKDNLLKPIETINTQAKLPSAVYEVNMTESGEVYFEAVMTNYDAIIHLPGTQFDRVVAEIETFLKPETEAKYKKNGFLYKRSALLEGPPGAGKTFIVNRVTEKVLQKDGVVLFAPNPLALIEALRVLDALQPETVVLVIFEELDKLMENYEGALLNVLDGEIQKERVIYLGTTNYINKIPKRIRRPGRFSSTIHVGFPSIETRKFYLEQKLQDTVLIESIVAATEGFSIDELKEIVLSVTCLDKTVAESVAQVNETREHGGSKNEDGDWEDDWDGSSYNETTKSAVRDLASALDNMLGRSLEKAKKLKR